MFQVENGYDFDHALENVSEAVAKAAKDGENNCSFYELVEAKRQLELAIDYLLLK